MSLLGKARKIGHFIGPARFDGPPVFANSMPKAGTNLFEGFLIALGYKRNPVQCLNESNIAKARMRPRRGRFYVAHLAEDALFSTEDHVSFLIIRPLWDCIRSYVNYMHIDTAHPISQFIRDIPLETALDQLLFTADNPNARPLVDEYLRFAELDTSRYQQIVSFKAMLTRDPTLISGLSDHLGAPEERIDLALATALERESYTKNLGRIDLFTALPEARLADLRAKVEARETSAFRPVS